MVFFKLPLKLRFSNCLLLLTLCLIVLLYFNNFEVEQSYEQVEVNIVANNVLLHKSVVNSFYEKRKSWTTSVLGSILFKNEDYPEIQKSNKTYVILIWKRWEFLQKRHLYYFGSTWHDPLEECSVKNCIFAGNDSLLHAADAVVVHLHTALIPLTEYRNPDQKWIYLDDEAPKNSFSQAKKKPTLSELSNVFNWSMTYRSDADIPVPYGRTVPLKEPVFSNTEGISYLVPNWKDKRRDVLATILMSNCISYRMKLLGSLKKYLTLNIYGKCGDDVNLKTSCLGHFRANCDLISRYLFYIVLENTKCKEYMTEKLFYNAYSKGAIPIIQGPSVEDCEMLLPPNSYLHFDNYATIEDLAKDIVDISKDEVRLLSYHSWRNHFEISNEHGYFGSKSFHLCRLCEAMNYNDKTISSYSEKDLKKFLDTKALCRN